MVEGTKISLNSARRLYRECLMNNWTGIIDSYLKPLYTIEELSCGEIDPIGLMPEYCVNCNCGDYHKDDKISDDDIYKMIIEDYNFRGERKLYPVETLTIWKSAKAVSSRLNYYKKRISHLESIINNK